MHDIYDSQGVKWIAQGQFLSEKQIAVALAKGTLSKTTFSVLNLVPHRANQTDLKPTFNDIIQLTGTIEQADHAKTEDLKTTGRLTAKTEQSLAEASKSILDLIQSTRFSPYKLTGLTSFLYSERAFKTKRPFLKTLNNSGTQHLLFNGIMDDNISSLIDVSLLNPFQVMEQLAGVSDLACATELSTEAFTDLCQQSSKLLLKATADTRFNTGFGNDLLKYFSPHLYFTSPENRLFQQINQYINFVMPGLLSEKQHQTSSDIPIINLANYFKTRAKGGGLGIEGARIVHYVGLLPSGTAIQFKNREKALIIAPKNKDTLYCAVLTGMDGQPMASPSLREIQFRDLHKNYQIIHSSDLPLQYEQHSHEKIWKMHIVHENLKKV